MGNKMTASEIIRLLEILIGTTNAVGESNADEQIHKNLQTLVDVVNWGLESIHTSSFTCGRPEYSMHKVGYDAKCVLDEYRRWLDDMCGEEGQDGPIITPCRGCSDYDGYGGCKSKGGCARAKMEVKDV